jgi:uncharacterized protein YcbK (DUF882 family)
MADNRFNGAQTHEVGVYSIAEMGSDFAVSEHFTLDEFACGDGSDVVLIHPKLIALLEAIRTHYGSPVFINSAYRSHQHNASIGGAKRSRHLYGFAADIRVVGVYPHEVSVKAEHLDAGGVGRYETFTHVDVYGANRRWSK